MILMLQVQLAVEIPMLIGDVVEEPKTLFVGESIIIRISLLYLLVVVTIIMVIVIDVVDVILVGLISDVSTTECFGIRTSSVCAIILP